MMKSLPAKLAISIAGLIIIIELVLLTFSINIKTVELAELQRMEQEYHGEISLYTDDYIISYLREYQANIIILSIIVSLFVSIGFYFIYYQLVGRYLKRIYLLNNTAKPLLTMNAFQTIPENEIGELIKSRFSMLKRLEEEMLISKRLLRILSHDLANLLTVILGNIALLRRKESVDTDNFHSKLDKIEFAAQQQKVLIDRIRTMEARVEREQKVNLEPCSLSLAIRDSIRIFEEQLKNKNLSVELNFPENDLFQIEIDKVLLWNNVLNNLISNSIKFSQENGKIGLTLRNIDTDSVELTLRDEGVGIPKKMLATLFTGGVQNSRIGTHGEKGTGFGMGLVKDTLDLFAATLQIYSKTIEADGKNHGTTFKLTFHKSLPQFREISP